MLLTEDSADVSSVVSVDETFLGPKFVFKCDFASRPPWPLGSRMPLLIKFASKNVELLFHKL